MFTTTKPHYSPETIESVGLAAALAKSGVRTEEGMSAELPTIHTEAGKENAGSEKPDADSAAQSQTAPTEASLSATEVKGSDEIKPPIVTKDETVVEPPKAQTLQEVLRNFQPQDVLKELGLDEGTVSFARDYAALPKEMQGFLSHWKSKGDVKEYLQELSTDYSKMQPEDVMRHQLRREHSDMSEEDFEVLYQIKVVNRYKLDPETYTDEEVRQGRVELQADVKPMRQTLIEAQKNYLLPAAPEAKSEPDTQDQQKQAIETIVSGIKQSKDYTDIANGKKLVIGQGDERFSFPVEPESLVDVLYNPNSFAEALLEVKKNADGSEYFAPKDIKSQMVVGAIMKYGTKFLDEYAKHHRALGALGAIAPIDNVKPPEGGTPAKFDQQPSTLAGAMAKAGKRVVSN